MCIMSKNNLILVVHHDGKHYVLKNCCADTQWNAAYVKEYVKSDEVKWTNSRANALVLAHNMQNRLDTEYGVRELFLDERKPKRKRNDA